MNIVTLRWNLNRKIIVIRTVMEEIKMKEMYITPEMETIILEREDVVRTSGGNELPFIPFAF